MKLRSFTFSKILIGVLIAGVIAVGCEYDATDDQPVFAGVAAAATGSQEVPAVTTLATASVTGTYNRNTRALSYTLQWHNLKDSATGAHFHGPALPGQNAGILVNIFTTRMARSGIVNSTVTLADTVAQHFLNGRIYVNVHSKVHPGGEVRGQVNVQ